MNPVPIVRRVLLALAAAGALAASPAQAHDAHGKPMYGGVVAEAGAFQAELVSGPKGPTLYVTDHGTPVPTAGAAGKLTVVAGGARSDLELVPAGGNRLAPAQAGVPLPAGARAVATVRLADGRSGALRFELK